MAEADQDPLIGALVGDRYRVGRKLGEGGMGVVYLAVHEALHKQVALKVLGTSGKIDRDAIARFEREAIATANLRHPNIAESTDFGQLPDGGLYLVMEYIEGTTLRRLLAEQGKLAPERAIAILQQIGAALAMAHARDVVHRDLKPENVIVTSVPESGRSRATDAVKVIDFGIAKLRSATFGGGNTGLTSAGTVFGTPTYMSPEQVMGQTVDARADQYALGVLAFELLTGRPPYKSDDVGQLMMMHVGAPVPSTREQTPGLPPEIDTVTTRMLAKLPAERFDSVADAMDALAAALFAPSAAPANGAAPASGARPGPSSAEIADRLAPPPAPAMTAVPHKTTLPSPRALAETPGFLARRWLVIAIAAFAACIVLLGALIVVLLGRRREEPVRSSPELTVVEPGAEQAPPPPPPVGSATASHVAPPPAAPPPAAPPAAPPPAAAPASPPPAPPAPPPPPAKAHGKAKGKK